MNKKNEKNVLLIVPASIKENWIREIEVTNTHGVKNFNINTNKKRLKIMTSTEMSNKDLTQQKDRKALDMLRENYSLVIIDEAHRFRNDGSFEDGVYHKNKNYANLKYIKSTDKRYALLSATPLNNSILDLHNLIEIFLNPTVLKNYDSSLTFSDFKEYQKKQKQIMNEMKKDAPDHDLINSLKGELDTHLEGIKCILEEVMILRTRTEISKRYPNLKIGGKRMQFQMPEINPQKYVSGEEYDPIFEGVADLLASLHIPHISLTNEVAGANLTGLFKVLLFKRLESSIYSFTHSLEKLLWKEQELRKEIKKDGWEVAKSRRRGNEDLESQIENELDLTSFISSFKDSDDDKIKTRKRG